MKRIPLTKGEYATVDDSDYEWLMQWKWTLDKREVGTSYAYRTVIGPNGPTSLRMHQLIMDSYSGVEVDHIDGNGLNNQRSNLRLASRSEQAWNAKGLGKGMKGVTFQKRLRKRPWQARIAYNGKQMHLGYYTTEKEAGEAYDFAAILLFGDFAKTNVMLEAIK